MTITSNSRYIVSSLDYGEDYDHGLQFEDIKVWCMGSGRCLKVLKGLCYGKLYLILCLLFHLRLVLKNH